MAEDTIKVSANRQKKEQVVAELSEKLGRSKAVVFTNYQGLTHKQIEELKKAIKPLDADFVVAKNTLVLRSLNESKLKLSDEKQLEGPTGTMVIYGDIVGPLKALAKMVKELSLPTIKLGLLENKEITAAEVTKISALPPREVLIAQFVGGMKSPIFGLHRALNWNLQKLVLTLGAVAKAKPAQAAPAPVTEAPATELQEQPVAEATVEEAQPVEETTVPEEAAATQTEDQNADQKTEGGEN